MCVEKQDNGLLYELALALAPGIGPRIAGELLAHFGTAQEVMRATAKQLMCVPGMGAVRVKALKHADLMRHAEKEMAFAARHAIRCLFIGDHNYPSRLQHCSDAPLMLFYRGNADLNAAKIIAIVGTRKHTDYGEQLCTALVEGLGSYGDAVVVSGLAYGIDAVAHKTCVGSGLPTVGVLAHGLDRIYPPAHRRLAREMLAGGGLLTEFPSGTGPDKVNFPVRNRIVAGMSDITVVVESGLKGGAVITAYLASGYNREVAAFPGRVHDEASRGCNMLIRASVAAMITGAEDLAALMGWTPPAPRQAPPALQALTPEEQAILQCLAGKDQVHADTLLTGTSLDTTQLAAGLLRLELQGIIRALPGRYYKIIPAG